MLCKLCDHDSKLVSANYPGYQEGKFYDIYECLCCKASFAAPLESDEQMYRRIYNNAAVISGYDRYYRYFEKVRRTKSPLDFLAAQEETYWAVARYLRNKRQLDRSITVLEIGSGLGYFTYALAKDGFEAKGLDISRSAVDRAREIFGDFFICTDLQSYANTATQTFDIVVMNQLIEHVPDIGALLRAALKILAVDGEIIITTPNKSIYKDDIWHTDSPPIHLWWLVERSFESLAEKYGLAVKFVDFTEFYKTYYRQFVLTNFLNSPSPILNRSGGVISPVQKKPFKEILSGVADGIHLMSGYRKLRDFMTHNKRWQGAYGPVLGVVFSKTGMEEGKKKKEVEVPKSGEFS